jgi:hypothetical protein
MSQWDDDALFLTVDVARVLQISASAVLWLASTGRLPHVRSVGGVRVWKWRTVRKFKEAREKAIVSRAVQRAVVAQVSTDPQGRLPLVFARPQRLPAVPASWRKRVLTIEAALAGHKARQAKAVLQAPTVKARANGRRRRRVA